MAKTKKTRNRPWLKIVIIVATIVAFVAFLYFMTPLGFISRLFLAPNYAEQEAKPIEKALVEAGAVKKCSNGDKGFGPDNTRPWYSAYFVIPEDKTEAINKIQEASKKTGYNLVEVYPDINRKHNRFFDDTTDKRNPYSHLNDGEVDVSVTVFGNSEHNGGRDGFCGVKDTDTPPQDKTVISLDVNLPYAKGY